MTNFLLLAGLGATEMIIIAVVILLLFGGRKIPELMKGLGKGVKSFKDGMNGVDDAQTNSQTNTDKEKSAKDNE